MRDPGEGVSSVPVSCKAWTSLWDSSTRSLLQWCDGQGRGQILSQSGFQSQTWQCRLHAPKLLSCYHNNMAHPLQSRHSMPGVQCSAIALTRFTFILFLYYLLFGIEKEHSRWVSWCVLPACPKTPGYKGTECPDGTVLHSCFEDLENKWHVYMYGQKNTCKKQFSISGNWMSQLFVFLSFNHC